HNVAVIDLAARSMIAAGNSADAKALLQPLLSRGSAWRKLWLGLGGTEIENAQDASHWLELAAASIAPEAAAEQLVMAEAWLSVDRRLGYQPARSNARQILQTLTSRPDADPSALFLMASIENDAGNYDAAEDLYRRILKNN